MMEKIVAFSDWLWAYPLLFILAFGGIYVTIRLKFMQILKLPLIIKTIFKDATSHNGGDGNITALQAGLTAIGSTLGAGNIMGVAIAVSMGGVGALFWMLFIGIFATCLKYSEIVLGIKYREKNEFGDYVGGAMYYLKNSKLPILGTMFAAVVSLQFIPSIGTQALSVVQSAETLGIPNYVTGIVMFAIMFITVIGGVKRIATFMDAVVPFMSIGYFILSWIIILYNYENIPIIFGKMFAGAFSAPAAFGGLAGSGVAMTIRAGLARGTYSNEAGMGTTPTAYAAATTDFPARQGLWGMLEVVTSTFIMCLTSGLLVTTSGVYEKVSFDKAASMPAVAFQNFYGEFWGGIFMTVIIILFVMSTSLVEVFMGQKQSEYLFGSKVANYTRYIFIGMVLVGSFTPLGDIVSLLDLTLAFLVAINMFAVITMVGDVVEETKIFFEFLKNNEK